MATGQSVENSYTPLTCGDLADLCKRSATTTPSNERGSMQHGDGKKVRRDGADT
jgi:hypothetical protein